MITKEEQEFRVNGLTDFARVLQINLNTIAEGQGKDTCGIVILNHSPELDLVSIYYYSPNGEVQSIDVPISNMTTDKIDELRAFRERILSNAFV